MSTPSYIDRLEAAEAVCRHVENMICDTHGIEPGGKHPPCCAASVGVDTWKLLTAWRHTFAPPAAAAAAAGDAGGKKEANRD